jgi:hypothetical protein
VPPGGFLIEEFKGKCQMKEIGRLRKANRRISNIEPQNFEGWFRFAQSILIVGSIYKIKDNGIQPN